MNAKPANAFVQSVSVESHSGLQGKGHSVFSMFSSAYARERREAMSLTDYLEGCRDDPSMYSTAAERMTQRCVSLQLGAQAALARSHRSSSAAASSLEMRPPRRSSAITYVRA